MRQTSPRVSSGVALTFTLLGAWARLVGLLDVRYAPIATKFWSAAECRDVPGGDIVAHSAKRGRIFCSETRSDYLDTIFL